MQQTDDDGEEQYEFCPYCGNDMFLVDGELPQELLSTIPRKVNKPYKPVVSWFRSKEQWEQMEQERYAKEDAALDYYATQVNEGKQNAERLYFDFLLNK
jgi:hypothetical protein